jgi:uncharacterized membrane protein YfcA
MVDILILIIVFLIGIVSSLLAGITGTGASFIAIPSLILTGLPVQTAIATRRFAGLGEEIIALFQFIKARLINWRVGIVIAFLTTIGTIIGSNILINTNEELVHKILGIAMFVALPFLFSNNGLGIKKRKVKKYHKYLGYFLYFITEIIESFIAVVGSAFTTIILVGLMGLTYLEANATKKVSSVLMAIIGSIIFAFYGIINYQYGIVLLIGMTIGSFVGTKIAIQKGNKFIRLIFSILVIIFAIKLIFFP